MSRGTRVRVVVVLTVSAWLLLLAPAQAYIDGGSVSVIFQALVAGIAAIGTGIAVSWHRISAFFKRDRSGGAAEGEADAAADDREHV